MSVGPNQPEIRFNAIGPYSRAGVSFVPKTIMIEKVFTTATENDDFMVMPAGSFLTEVVAVCTDAADADTHVTLGIDSDADAFITETAFTLETVGNFAKFSTGSYFAAADTLRIAVAGTPVAGAVRFLISYFELEAMHTQGVHFDL